MDKFLKPERLSADPQLPESKSIWIHWYQTFQNFVAAVPQQNLNKLSLLHNFVAPTVYGYISDVSSYEEGIRVLKALYVKPTNTVINRYKLATMKQNTGESLDSFLERLKMQAKQCQFKALTEAETTEQAILDAYIAGIENPKIRQRLLENISLKLSNAVDQARALEQAEKSSEKYCQIDKTASEPIISQVSDGQHVAVQRNKFQPSVSKPNRQPQRSAKCPWCAGKRHPRTSCPARNAQCHKCHLQGHWSKACRSNLAASVDIEEEEEEKDDLPVLASISTGLYKAVSSIHVDNNEVMALFDSGSSLNFVTEEYVMKNKLHRYPYEGGVTMASKLFSSEISGYCKVSLVVYGQEYKGIKLYILPKLCFDVIIGHDFLKLHEKVVFELGGPRKPLHICGLAGMKVEPHSLFSSLSPNCKPIAIRSRNYSKTDREFISSEVNRLLKEGVIEPSRSPWRAQVLVANRSSNKRRMVIDFSQTINRHTFLDAYPLPRINSLVNQVAQYGYYSSVDLRSAYHQIPIIEADKVFTAFEANGKLYQFRRIPFGVTNGVSCF